MAEAYMNIQSDSGRREEAVNIGRWWELFSTAMDRQGKDSRVGTIVTNPNQRAWTTLADLLRSAGFTDIQIDQPRLPIGVWPSGTVTIPPRLSEGSAGCAWNPWLIARLRQLDKRDRKKNQSGS